MLGTEMLALTSVVDFAKSAVAVLIAILAIYLSIRLLGKLAKFVITIIVVVFVIWFLANSGILGQILSGIKSAGLGLSLL